MRSHRLILLATLAAATPADARPKHVVVLDFDGPRQLADAGRDTVMGLLASEYDVIAAKRWEAARAKAPGKAADQWRRAAKVAGVDAVIEGWVQDEGRHHVLTVSIHDATTGNEVDTISVKLADRGISSEAARQLGAQIDDVFGFIDGAIDDTGDPPLPDAREELRPRSHHLIQDQDQDQDEPAPAPVRPPPPPPQVAAADAAKETSELAAVLGTDSHEAAVVAKVAPHKPTPRFMIGGGAYLASRGMTFDADPSARESPPTYPASSISGLAVNAAVYPWPTQREDGLLSGVGFTFSLAHSVGATLTAMDDTGYGDYTIDHLAWEAGVHYRWPLHLVSIDTELDYGNVTHTIVDLPQSIAIPDTSYTYLGAGAHLELAVTDGVSVGFGARYLYMLSTGDISSEDWYGAGSAWGVALDGDFVIPIHGPLYARGVLDYRRFHIDYEGSGALTMRWGVWDSDDTSITGAAQLGVMF